MSYDKQNIDNLFRDRLANKEMKPANPRFLYNAKDRIYKTSLKGDSCITSIVKLLKNYKTLFSISSAIILGFAYYAYHENLVQVQDNGSIEKAKLEQIEIIDKVDCIRGKNGKISDIDNSGSQLDSVVYSAGNKNDIRNLSESPDKDVESAIKHSYRRIKGENKSPENKQKTNSRSSIEIARKALYEQIRKQEKTKERHLVEKNNVVISSQEPTLKSKAIPLKSDNVALVNKSREESNMAPENDDKESAIPNLKEKELIHVLKESDKSVDNVSVRTITKDEKTVKIESNTSERNENKLLISTQTEEKDEEELVISERRKNESKGVSSISDKKKNRARKTRNGKKKVIVTKLR